MANVRRSIQPLSAVWRAQPAAFRRSRVSDVFQEVQEEYRRQQLEQLWAKYRTPIIAAASALVLGVAGYQGWNYWHGTQVEKSSRELDAIAEVLSSGAGREKEASDRLAKLATSGAGGYSVAAKFQEAALRAQLGDSKAAVALYDRIADGTSEALLHDFAQLRAAILIIETEKYDALKARLEPISAPGRPWRAPAMEMLAYATWRAGKKDEALKIYADVQALPDVPQGVKRRSIEMSALIRDGMKVSDIKTTSPSSLLLPGGDIGPLLLPPTPAPGPTAPAQPSLLGPDPIAPAVPAPAAPAPTTP